MLMIDADDGLGYATANFKTLLKIWKNPLYVPAPRLANALYMYTTLWESKSPGDRFLAAPLGENTYRTSSLPLATLLVEPI